MTCAWSGTLAQLKALVATGGHVRAIQDGFEAVYQRSTQTERDSWGASLPELARALKDSLFDELQVLVELQMPMGGERADVILLGGTSERSKGMVVELKQWSDVRADQDMPEVHVGGLGTQQHPSIQAMNYAGKLRFFNAAAHNYAWRAVVFLHNLDAKGIEGLQAGERAAWVSGAPLYGAEDYSKLAASASAHLLPCSLPGDERARVDQAPYEQSQHLIGFLSQHALDIAKGAEGALANSGMGLTLEQAAVQNRVLRALEGPSGQDFIVQGTPGSGKTLLAVSLLLKAMEQGRTCMLAIRNNRLHAILRAVFDKAYPGASGVMAFFLTQGGTGIGQRSLSLDLLILDEAQRMQKSIMDRVLRNAKVTAVFLDETQRLNPPEEGTLLNFASASTQAGRTATPVRLSTSVRGFGGTAYHQWVEHLLATPGDVPSLRLADQRWRTRYTMEACASLEDMIARLRELKGPSDRVALVASFTESPGKKNNPGHAENLRIGYPLTSGFPLYQGSNLSIPWLMQPAEYRAFWMDGRSNRLETVASIYGTQGFESDYVGVVWGRDFVYRDGHWVLGDANVCYDAIDRLVSGGTARGGSRHWSPEAPDLVRNRYRIFLTRGIKGTLIFCEDEETKRHLLGL